MTYRIPAAIAAALLALAISPGFSASGEGAPGASPLVVAQASGEAPARRSGRKARASKREPTAAQMAARERQKKCAAEWRSAKADGVVARGAKWPKFWSQCNARLKGNSA